MCRLNISRVKRETARYRTKSGAMNIPSGHKRSARTAGIAERRVHGLVRVGVQSAIPHPETAALLRKLMKARGIPVPPEGRTLQSICITDICKPEG